MVMVARKTVALMETAGGGDGGSGGGDFFPCDAVQDWARPVGWLVGRSGGGAGGRGRKGWREGGVHQVATGNRTPRSRSQVTTLTLPPTGSPHEPPIKINCEYERKKETFKKIVQTKKEEKNNKKKAKKKKKR